jgi:hypothetical protein
MSVDRKIEHILDLCYFSPTFLELLGEREIVTARNEIQKEKEKEIKKKTTSTKKVQEKDCKDLELLPEQKSLCLQIITWIRSIQKRKKSNLAFSKPILVIQGKIGSGKNETLRKAFRSCQQSYQIVDEDGTLDFKSFHANGFQSCFVQVHLDPTMNRKEPSLQTKNFVQFFQSSNLFKGGMAWIVTVTPEEAYENPDLRLHAIAKKCQHIQWLNLKYSAARDVAHLPFSACYNPLTGDLRQAAIEFQFYGGRTAKDVKPLGSQNTMDQIRALQRNPLAMLESDFFTTEQISNYVLHRLSPIAPLLVTSTLLDGIVFTDSVDGKQTMMDYWKRHLSLYVYQRYPPNHRIKFNEELKCLRESNLKKNGSADEESPLSPFLTNRFAKLSKGVDGV